MTDLPVVQGSVKKGGTKAVIEMTADRSLVEEFSVPAHDVRGHSARVGFRVVPDMTRLVAELVQGGGAVFGWRTDSDFWRWAGMAAYEYAAGRLKDKRISNSAQQVRFMMNVVAAKQRMMDFEENFAEIERTVQRMNAGGDEEEVEGMLVELRETIMQMDDDKDRKRWVKRFDKKFKVRGKRGR